MCSSTLGTKPPHKEAWAGINCYSYFTACCPALVPVLFLLLAYCLSCCMGSVAICHGLGDLFSLSFAHCPEEGLLFGSRSAMVVILSLYCIRLYWCGPLDPKP